MEMELDQKNLIIGNIWSKMQKLQNKNFTKKHHNHSLLLIINMTLNQKALHKEKTGLMKMEEGQTKLITGIT